MAAGDSYRLVINATYLNQLYQNTLALSMNAATEPAAADFLVVANDFKETFRGRQHINFAYTTWEATQLWGSTMVINRPLCTRSGGKSFAGVMTGSLAGADNTADCLPPQCAFVVTLLTGFAGRRKRGRWYTPCYSEASQAGGIWGTAFLSAEDGLLTTFMNKYKQGGTSPFATLGIWSERTASGCIPNPSGHGHTNVDTPSPETAMTTVTGYTMRATVFNQRRRTLGVGR